MGCWVRILADPWVKPETGSSTERARRDQKQNKTKQEGECYSLVGGSFDEHPEN